MRTLAASRSDNCMLKQFALRNSVARNDDEASNRSTNTTKGEGARMFQRHDY